MTEAWFYHLERQSLEQVLPGLIERSLQRGWKAAVQAGSEERLAVIDDHLWTYRDDSFLPHGFAHDSDAAMSPVVLTLGEDNPNGAAVRFLIDGAGIPDEALTGASPYERLILLFDGNDAEALARARAQWTKARESGLASSYYQQDGEGRWEKKA